jgi:hypothetical protein
VTHREHARFVSRSRALCAQQGKHSARFPGSLGSVGVKPGSPPRAPRSHCQPSARRPGREHTQPGDPGVNILSGKNRGERIRTSDLSVPNRTRYQTALRPESRGLGSRAPACCQTAAPMARPRDSARGAWGRGCRTNRSIFASKVRLRISPAVSSTVARAAARERITAVMTRWHTQRSRSTSIACRERCRSVGAHATETTVQGVDVIAGTRDIRIDDRR